MITGLVLFAYVATHLINHALGLISLPAMGIGRSWFLALWRQPVGTVALYGSLTIHFALGLGALYARRGWRMPVSEAAQIVLGLAIVPLLAEHVLGTRILFELFDVKDTYTYVVLVLWHLAPEKGAVQAATLIIVWFHGCLGLHQWLRLKPHFSRFLPLYAVLAVLIPVLALLGFVTAGREIAALAEDRNWLREVTAAINFPGAAARAMVGDVKTFIWLGVAGLLGAVLALRVGRRLWERRRGIVRLSYPAGVEIGVPTGTSVLEASRLNRIPHASVCGGRGRCSTCRIRIGKGLDKLTPPSAAEPVLLLPEDPDASAAALKARLDARYRTGLAVIVNDSVGRAWRNGVVGIALGAAGLPALRDMVGRTDLFGRALEVTQTGFADEIAAAASLLMGQADEGLPAVLVRGLRWREPAADARALLRPKAQDLFR